nr:mitochondrial dicarboxylate carrier [Tanacetum cinerariifolium]
MVIILPVNFETSNPRLEIYLGMLAIGLKALPLRRARYCELLAECEMVTDVNSFSQSGGRRNMSRKLMKKSKGMESGEASGESYRHDGYSEYQDGSVAPHTPILRFESFFLHYSKGVMKDGLEHVTASFSAAFVVVVASDLVGMINTRMMNTKVAEGFEPSCKRPVDCAGNTVKAEMDEGQNAYKGVSVKEYLVETVKRGQQVVEVNKRAWAWAWYRRYASYRCNSSCTTSGAKELIS